MAQKVDPELEIKKDELKSEVLRFPVPPHIGIIMDGNGRWAKSHGLTRIQGHQNGARNVKKIVRFADKLGVKYISLYAFSVENWARPSFEVSALMRLIHTYIVRERMELHEEGVKFRISGRTHELAPEIIHEAKVSSELTASNTGLTLNLCINYGGRAEIVDAVKKILIDKLPFDEIDEKAIARRLYSPDIPDPDLIIRTSGEMRVSNFLLWQSAYSEIYFSEVMWPDFNDFELLKAIHSFQKRERRFGKTSEQVAISQV